MCVSKDRSRHEDSNGPRIVKIGAILAIFEHFKVWTSAQGQATPRSRPVLKKTSVSQMIDLVMTVRTVQESSKLELSSRFLSTSKFGPPRKTSAQDLRARSRKTFRARPRLLNLFYELLYLLPLAQYLVMLR